MSPVRLVGTALLLVAAVIAQLSVLPTLRLPGATPDLVVVVVVALALAAGPATGAATGFAAGLLLDLAPPADHPVGQWALVHTVVGYAAGRVAEERERSVLVALLLAAGAAAAAPLAVTAFGAVLGDPRASWSAVSRLLPSAVVYAVVLAAFVVPGILALYRPTSSDPMLR